MNHITTPPPGMTAIGNHEIGYSGSWIPGADSGGECGIPYSQYFRMPAPANTGKADTPWSGCVLPTKPSFSVQA